MKSKYLFLNETSGWRTRAVRGWIILAPQTLAQKQMSNMNSYSRIQGYQF